MGAEDGDTMVRDWGEGNGDWKERGETRREMEEREKMRRGEGKCGGGEETKTGGEGREKVGRIGSLGGEMRGRKG